MGMLDSVAARVAAGERVEFRPSGDSMVPLIRSRQRVAVAPVDAARLAVGDIVLARVAGTVYLHLVSAVDPARRRVQISNNRGRVNGWTGYDRVFGPVRGGRRFAPARRGWQDRGTRGPGGRHGRDGSAGSDRTDAAGVVLRKANRWAISPCSACRTSSGSCSAP
jgi:hypothetical protein